MDISPLASPIDPRPPTVSDPLLERRLQAAASALEASFLAVMLKSAGVGATRESLGGGAGEDQFSSFLVTAQAEEMVKAGGIGLAERLFDALQERTNDTV